MVAGYLPEVDILSGVSIRVKEEQIVTVIGPNGAGKSTLIKTIFGLLRPRFGGSAPSWRGNRAGLKPITASEAASKLRPAAGQRLPNTRRRTWRWAFRPLQDQRADRLAELFRASAKGKAPARDHDDGASGRWSRWRGAHADPGGAPRRALGPAWRRLVEAIFQKVEERQSRRRDDRDGGAECAPRPLMSNCGYVLDLGQDRFEGPGKEPLTIPRSRALSRGTARVDEPRAPGRSASRDLKDEADGDLPARLSNRVAARARDYSGGVTSISSVGSGAPSDPNS